MKDASNLKLAMFGVLLSTGIAVAVMAFNAANMACADDTIRIAMKISEANGCIEFWLNRYQTVVIGALAAGIALFGIVPAIGQMTQSVRQGLNLERQILAERIREHQTEATAVTLLQQPLYIATQLAGLGAPSQRRDPAALPYAQQLENVGNAMTEASGNIERFMISEPDERERTERRKAIVETTADVIGACQTLAILYPLHLRTGLTTEEEFNAREVTTLVGAQELRSLLDAHKRDLESAIERGWREIRSLEDRILKRKDVR